MERWIKGLGFFEMRIIKLNWYALLFRTLRFLIPIEAIITSFISHFLINLTPNFLSPKWIKRDPFKASERCFDRIIKHQITDQQDKMHWSMAGQAEVQRAKNSSTLWNSIVYSIPLKSILVQTIAACVVFLYYTVCVQTRWSHMCGCCWCR